MIPTVLLLDVVLLTSLLALTGGPKIRSPRCISSTSRWR